MIIVWGTTHAGKVDEVPGGMFHVVTRFGHLYYLPLIPMASFVVLEKTPGGFHGTQIPLSLKSIGVAWLRVFCVFAMIVCGVILLVAAIDEKAGRWDWIGPSIIAAVILAALVMTYRLGIFARASYERAKLLATYARINDIGALALEVAYGRLSPAEAEAELARRRQADPSAVERVATPVA